MKNMEIKIADFKRSVTSVQYALMAVEVAMLGLILHGIWTDSTELNKPLAIMAMTVMSLWYYQGCIEANLPNVME